MIRTKTRTIVAVAALTMALAAWMAPSAFAVGVKIVPTPTEAQPLVFTVTMGAVTFRPAGAEYVACEKGLGTGSFTSADKGTATLRFSGCAIDGSPSLKCLSGSESGVLQTVSLPLYVTETGSGKRIIINPDQESGPPPLTVVPQFHCGGAGSGPITGVPSLAVPVNTKISSFESILTRGNPTYFNEHDVWKTASPGLSWVSTLGEKEELQVENAKATIAFSGGHQAEFSTH